MEIHPSFSCSQSVLAMDAHNLSTNRSFQLNAPPAAAGPNNSNPLFIRSYNSSPASAGAVINDIQHLAQSGSYITNGSASADHEFIKSAHDYSRPSDHHPHPQSHHVLQSTANVTDNSTVRSVQLSVIPEHTADELNTTSTLHQQHVNHHNINDNINNYNGCRSSNSSGNGVITANFLQRSNSGMDMASNNLLNSRFNNNNHSQSVGTALIRQSSSPAKLLSRVAMEECTAIARPAAQRFCSDSYIEAMVRGNMSTNQPNTAIKKTNHHHQHHQVSPLVAPAPVQQEINPESTDLDHRHHQEMNGMNNVYNNNSNLMVNKSALFRQNSSPAGLLSQQLSMSGYSSADQEDGFHDDQDFMDHHDGTSANYFALRQNKRLREMGINCGAMLDGINYSGAGVIATDGVSGFSFADTVLCRARAKRGCATHPRSIAERVRRTKISDRMRKLQELVPNMEKQTNIAAMLDEAIDYVKYLQQQVQELSENQSQCNGQCHDTTAKND